ncbi:SHOCT domain-containing protein [Actinomycetospora sp. DW7H6]|uniref:SHOCT domain-containing protein n=2 Tax=Actinomycetospora lemnae TaxID=3019891 RepID=A0ABT5SZT1_9PSEU|nr:SHOCT domain-containing protein [Actinomycetospora sp. DW7H6]MDD7967940.1 SHOCT domain-containing protein [Actinomycetospora sp. DW7H6]
MWGYGWDGGWMVPLMGVSAVLWWVLVVAIVVGVVRWLRVAPGGTSGGPGPRGEARDILDRRFARGEIDADEYAERRRVLSGG